MSKLRRTVIFLAFLSLLLLTVLLGIACGSVRLPIGEVIRGLFTGEGKSGVIVRLLRLPRVLGAVLSGAALATAGALLQSACANDLTSPSTVGINAGAGAAVMICYCFFPSLFSLESAFAFFGAMLALVITLALAGKRGRASRSSVVLAGVAVGAVFSAITSFLSLRFPDALVSYASFSVGGYSGVYMKDIAVPAAMILPLLVCAFLISARLNLLSLGDTLAISMGVRTGALRTLAITLAAALASASVSYAGLVGFVGLIAPHLAARLIGSDERLRIPFAAVLGACLTTSCDLVGRVAFSPTELSSGILLNLIGAPFFLAILIFGKRRGEE